MGLFNFLETFFIISLAIMFVLVGLLMYHIRTRLNASEQRIDTLYEIVTNLSNEINAQKVHIANLHYGGFGGNAGAAQNMVPFQPTMTSVKKIVVSDDDADDDTDEESENSGDEYTNTDFEEVESDIILEKENLSAVGAGSGDDDAADHYMDEIHIIKLQGSEKTVNDVSFTEVTTDIDVDVDADVDDCIESGPIDGENIVSAVVDDSISLNAGSAAAVDEEVPLATAELEEDDVSLGSLSAEGEATNEENYHKMNLSSLKKLAKKRELASVHDISRMKKGELIALLQQGQ